VARGSCPSTKICYNGSNCGPGLGRWLVLGRTSMVAAAACGGGGGVGLSSCFALPAPLSVLSFHVQIGGQQLLHRPLLDPNAVSW
jgi:hypothetical protein